MTDERILSEARIIAGRLSDFDSIWFHYKAVKLLGFQICYELSSLALEAYREGRITTSLAKFYNGCVLREVEERGIEW